MCGFACFIEPGRRFSAELLKAADTDLFHRGPDSGGHINEDGRAIVFRRLSIMDPTEASDQPLSDRSGQVTLFFNGEIYNFRELKSELQAAGVVFETSGDSEVVLQGYKTWGKEVLKRLEGMFALGILDRTRNVALVARDPLGIKPLYMARRNKLSAFASEVRPLRHVVELAVDGNAIAELLTFGWAAGRQSNYNGIDRVPGGILIEIDLSSGDVVERRYCDPLETLTSAEEAKEADAHEALLKSVSTHLKSDVGYGAQLSGGVDSSLIVALAAAESGSSLQTYAVGLEDKAYDEGEYRQALIGKYDVSHSELPFDGERFADALPSAIRAMEGPVPHGGCVALYALCREIRKKNKVVLTGEGADEMFGGYIRYALYRKLMWQERIDRLIPDWAAVPDLWPMKGVRRLRGRDYAAYASMYENLSALGAVFPGFLPSPPGQREADSARFSDFRDRLFAVDQTAYLESLLVRQDKMSMAHSVEARVPFVHMPLLQVVNALPRQLRTPGRVTKPVLKRLADQFLPHNLVHRRKVGLTLPYDKWISEERALGRYLDDLTSSNGRLRAYAEPARLDAAVDAFRRGERQSIPRLFSLINIELWLRSAVSA